MKSSAIVQGLKSWASALHPQLPLSRRESQRLLTALTSSFRRQLDDAHPQHENSDARPQPFSSGDGARKKERSHGMHSSSAAFADRHMASVLTNPLLVQGRAPSKPDATTIQAELQKKPGKDPIELLEEYHERGHATVSIALACLEAFEKSLDGLSENAKTSRIAEVAAGKRTLLWVWESGVFKDEKFVECRKFPDLLVDFTVKEGFESYLWEWLKIEADTGEVRNVPRDLPPAKKRLFSRRWKGRIIRGIIAAKLQGSSSCDSALEAYFKARELKDASVTPSAAARTLLHNQLSKSVAQRQSTSVDLYDRFTASLRDSFTDEAAFSEQHACWLDLLHPRRPSPLSSLKFLQRVFDHPEQALKWQLIRKGIQEHRSKAKTQRHYSFFLHTILQLEARDLFEDAAWVEARAKETFPQNAEALEHHKRTFIPITEQSERKQREASKPDASSQERTQESLHMPSFAV